MNKRTRIAAAAAGLTLAAVTTAALGTRSSHDGTTAPALSPAAATVGLDSHLTQHQFHLGESFSYFYDSTSSTYATQQAEDGQVPRVTDLQAITETRANVRVTIVLQAGKLMKKLDLLNVGYRAVSAADTQAGKPAVPFRTIQSLVPGFPTVFSYTYPVDGDNDAARNLNVIFKDYPDPRLFQLVDIFTWLGATATIPTTVGVGQVAVTPGVDVSLLGVTFHSSNQVLTFDRVDQVGGVNQAYFEQQTLGNYFASLGIETNVQSTFHVPLAGPATGLVSTGELQELAIQGGQGNVPRTATQRQVSMTLQTLDTRSSIGS